MSYTAQDYMRDFTKRELKTMPPEERIEILKELMLDERKKVVEQLSPEERREILKELLVKERLEGLPVEEVEKQLKQKEKTASTRKRTKRK